MIRQSVKSVSSETASALAATHWTWFLKRLEYLALRNHKPDAIHLKEVHKHHLILSFQRWLRGVDSGTTHKCSSYRSASVFAEIASWLWYCNAKPLHRFPLSSVIWYDSDYDLLIRRIDFFSFVTGSLIHRYPDVQSCFQVSCNSNDVCSPIRKSKDRWIKENRSLPYCSSAVIMSKTSETASSPPGMMTGTSL